MSDGIIYLFVSQLKFSINLSTSNITIETTELKADLLLTT